MCGPTAYRAPSQHALQPRWEALLRGNAGPSLRIRNANKIASTAFVTHANGNYAPMQSADGVLAPVMTVSSGCRDCRCRPACNAGVRGRSAHRQSGASCRLQSVVNVFVIDRHVDGACSGSEQSQSSATVVSERGDEL